MTEPIIKWLNKKRSNSAGWGSTVDTLLATESLLKWSAKFGEEFQEIEGGVAMEVESRYLRTHHMFSQILNFLCVIVFSRSTGGRYFGTIFWDDILG